MKKGCFGTRFYLLVGSVVLGLFLFGSAQAQNATMNGTVESVDKGIIGVRGDDGNFVYFQVGWRTKYNPDRLPNIGERIQVAYSMDGSYYIGYVFTILPPSPPPPTTPPPPPSPYVGPKDPYRGN